MWEPRKVAPISYPLKQLNTNILNPKSQVIGYEYEVRIRDKKTAELLN